MRVAVGAVAGWLWMAERRCGSAPAELVETLDGVGLVVLVDSGD